MSNMESDSTFIAEKVRKAIASWITVESMAKAATLVEDCPLEILGMVAALSRLADTTRLVGEDERADGFFLTAETTEERAAFYEESLQELCRVWGGPPISDEDEQP